MNFDEYIVNQIDKKYKEMLLGSNEKPKFPSIKSVTTYEDKKTEFFKRLNQEKNTFNNAIDTITKTRQDNLDEQTRIKEARRKAREEAERKRKQQEEEYNEKLKHDKKSIITLAVVISLIFVIVALIACFTIFKDANVWYKEVVMNEFGFNSELENPLQIFESQHKGKVGYIAFLVSVIITIIIWIGVGVIAFLGYKFKGLGIVAAVFGVGLIISCISISLPAIVIRYVLAFLAYLIQYLFYPWVALWIVLSISIPFVIKFLGLRFKKSKIITGVAFLPIIVLCTVLLCVYSSFAVSNNKKYYSHNASNFETAFSIKGEGTYNVDNLYYVYQDTYYKFVSEETANYNITTINPKAYSITLYDEQKNFICDNKERTGSSIKEIDPFCYTFEADKTYYIKVNQYYKNKRYTLKIEKTSVCQEIATA